MRQSTHFIKRNMFNPPNYLWGCFQEQRRCGEDFAQAKQLGQFRYFAVFDGHGHKLVHRMHSEYINQKDNQKDNQDILYDGDEHTHCASYAAAHLHERLASNLEKLNIADESSVTQMIIDTFIAFDRELLENNLIAGTTCTMILIDDENSKTYQINLGDSR